LLSLLPAQRKKKKSFTLKIRPLRSNQPTPANTSNLKGRANRAFRVRPALFPTNACPAIASADFPTIPHQLFALRIAALYVGRAITDSFRRISCGSLPLLLCLLLPPSLRAPSPRQSQSRCLPSPKSPYRTANTAHNQTGWARRCDPAAPVRHLPISLAPAPEQKVRPC
jgi:hypothetical protein